MKEFFKTFILIVLTVSAVYMTRVMFVKDSFEEVLSEIKYENVDPLKLIKPQNYSINFGDSFIKFYSDEYNNVNVREKFNNSFSSFVHSLNKIEFVQINESLWQEQLRKKLLRIDYPFPIKIGDLMTIHTGLDFSFDEDDSDISVSSILMLSSNKNSIYFYDETTKSYFIIKDLQNNTVDDSSSREWVATLIETIEQEEKSDVYRMLEEAYKFMRFQLSDYNLETPNLLLIPDAATYLNPEYEINREFDLAGVPSKEMKNIVNNIFESKADFVKKNVYSDSAIAYTLRYGERVLLFNPDGSVEYIAKPHDVSKSSKIDFIDGLTRAYDMYGKFGVDNQSVYLSNYETLEIDNKIETTYSFNIRKDNIPLYSNEDLGNSVFKVKFLNESLIYIQKNAWISDIKIYGTGSKVADLSKAMSRIRLHLEVNYEKDNPGLDVEKEDIAALSLNNMKSIEINYYVDTENEKIIPIWNIVIDQRRYLIDIFHYELIDELEIN